MNLDGKFKNFHIVREMLETPGIIRDFKWKQAPEAAQAIKATGKLFLTGEGSSRIFPAKNAITKALAAGANLQIATEGSRQAHEYDLNGYTVFGASNSGQTKEIISLFNQLREKGNKNLFGLTANQGTKLAEMSTHCYVLSCGKEEAVAATKSVVEQGLFYQALLSTFVGDDSTNLSKAADAAKTVLEENLNASIVDAIANAGTIYFAGRNNGVAEELALKTNEITRKKSDFLEGTYAVHGIEEVMNPDDVVIVVDPFETEEQKFKEVLVDGVGMQVFAVSSRKTQFPTIEIPRVAGFDPYLQLLAGWNVLIHVGVALGINLDKPVRARKVGNEFVA